MKTVVLAVALAFGFVATAQARECRPVVRDAWLRLPPVAMPMLAGFARIENPCPRAIVVTAASSPAFGDVSLHESRRENGVSRMRAVPALAVPARGAVVLQPGGLHLMLMQPTAMPPKGARVPVTLVMKDGRTIDARFEVRAAAPQK